MILSGVKTEEYREFKDYWINRLCDLTKIYKHNNYEHFNNFDTITFKNGYSKNAPEIVIVLNGITLGVAKPEWGGENNDNLFILHLGEILSTKNIKNE